MHVWLSVDSHIQLIAKSWMDNWTDNYWSSWASRWLSCKDCACQCRRHGFDPWVRKIPWRRKWQPTSVFLPGKSHGQRSLVGYSPWVPKESALTELMSRMQGIKIPHAMEQLSPVHHNYWAHAITRESVHCNEWSHMMQGGSHKLQLRPNTAKYIHIQLYKNKKT